MDKMSTMCILVSYVGCNKSPKTYKQQNLLNNRNLFSCLSGGHVCMLSHFSHGQMFVTTWAVARQAPLSMGFSRQEYWSGLPCPPPGESSRPRDQTHISYVSYWQVSPLPLTLPGRAEVQNQRVGGSVLPLKPLGECPCSPLWELLRAPGVPRLQLPESSVCLRLYMAFPPASVLSPLLSLIRTFLIGFRAHPDNPGWSRLTILNLSTQTLFPSKLTVTDLRMWTYNLPPHMRPHVWFCRGKGSCALLGLFHLTVRARRYECECMLPVKTDINTCSCRRGMTFLDGLLSREFIGGMSPDQDLRLDFCLFLFHCVLVTQSCLTLCGPMDCSCQAPLSMEFSGQDYWSE